MDHDAEQVSRRRGLGESARDLVPPVVTLVVAGLFSFLSGGYILVRSSPVAIVYLLLAAVWLWFMRPSRRPPLLYLCALAALGLFVVWSGLSVLWSIGPDLSWVSFNLAAFYLAVAVVVGLTPVRRLPLRVVAFGFFAVAVAVGIYAILGKVLPDVVTHARLDPRLKDPIGYYNVLALMMVMAVPVALAGAGTSRSRVLWQSALLRALIAAATVPVTLAFFFTLSRGGWLALTAVLAVFFVLTRERLASFVTLVVIGAPVAFAVWRVRHLETLFQRSDDLALRISEGHALLVWALIALAVVFVVQAIVAAVHESVRWPERASTAVGAVVLVVVLGGGIVGSWWYVDAQGGTAWVRERIATFSGDDDSRAAEASLDRLISLNTGRPDLWREAWQQWQYARVTGVGAGTFTHTHYRFRPTGGVVRHAHSQWFNVLSELGVVGLALYVPAMLLFLAAAIGNPLRYRGDPGRALLAALQAGVAGFLVHITWDWDWDMAAIGTVFFLLAGTCASYVHTRAQDERAEEARTWASGEEASATPAPALPECRPFLPLPARTAGSVLLVLLAVSWTFPYLAVRAENQALTAAADGDVAAAVADVQRAARYNPLSARSLILQAQFLQQLGRNREALAVLQEAQALQPDNYEVYLELGLLYARAFQQFDKAAVAFGHGLALNPLDRELNEEFKAALAN